jgi:hypothetical protein
MLAQGIGCFLLEIFEIDATFLRFYGNNIFVVEKEILQMRIFLSYTSLLSVLEIALVGYFFCFFFSLH